MRNFLFLLLFCTPQVLFSQTTVHRKIAQRSDVYQGAVWNGTDSFRWVYNANATRTQLTALKNSSGTWQNLYRYSYSLDAKDSVLLQLRENWVAGNFVNNTQYNYTYDANGNVVSIYYYVWNGTSWNPTGRIEYTGYNSKNKPASETVFIWNAGSWVNLENKNYQYYPNGYSVQYAEHFAWNSSTMQWDKVDRYYYTYNVDSISSITKIIGTPLNTWIESKKEIFTFSTTPFLRTKYETLNWDTTSGGPGYWKSDRRISYEYNVDETLNKTTTEVFALGMWQPVNRTQNIYNTDKELIETIQEKQTGVWENDTKKTISYVNHKPNEELSYLGAGTVWIDQEKRSYQYNSNMDMTFRQIDSSNGLVFTPYKRDFYYYQTYVVSSKDIDDIADNINIYPNPTNNLLHIEWKENNANTIQVALYDITGKLRSWMVQQLSSTHSSLQIDMHHLPSGNYVCVISDDRHVNSVQKMITKLEK